MIALTVSAATVACALSASGAAPKETVEVGINKVFDVLKDPALQADEKRQERREKLSGILNEYFDYREMSKRALGKQWNKLSGNERDEFVPIFRKLLERVYLDSFDKYSSESIQFGFARDLGKNKSVVETTVFSGSKEIPVDYNLLKRDYGWVVYDIKIEGVGLIKNYRTQFREVIQKKSYGSLVARLKDKVSRPPPVAKN
jgi:phospholipid transport system substrate-binding protein